MCVYIYIYTYHADDLAVVVALEPAQALLHFVVEVREASHASTREVTSQNGATSFCTSRFG